MKSYSFPTLGEVLKFLFNATDVISDSENKKLVQRQLQRLAKEEGNISDSLGRLFDIFRNNLEALIGDERVVGAISYSVLFIFNKYEEVVRNEGLCISREFVDKWLINNVLLNTLVFAQHKYFLMFNISASGLIAPGKILVASGN
jgi:hypothetical protein